MGGWNKGLTKETDERVRKNGEAISIAKTGRHPRFYKRTKPGWNKGLTKETDERVAKNGIAISRSLIGKTSPIKGKKCPFYSHSPWNKGLREDPRCHDNSIKSWESRKRNRSKTEPWNKGLTKNTDSRLQQISDKLTGVPLSNNHRKSISKAKKGKPAAHGYIKEVMAKVSKSKMGHPVNEYTRQRVRETNLGNKYSLGKKHSPERITRNREIALQLWSDPNHVAKVMRGRHRRPTKPEKFLISLFDNHFPDFKYNGDYRFGIVIDRLIPDFVNISGKKQVIEYFGDYWHENDNPDKKILRYKKYGFNCLIIRQDELVSIPKLIDKIGEFCKC